MQSLEEWIELDLGRSTKPLSPLMSRVIKEWQTIRQAVTAGDLTTLSTNLSQLKTLVDQVSPHLEDALKTTAAYHVRTYLADQFDGDFRRACAAANLPVEGQFPQYLIYPVRIQVDGRRMGVLINRRLHRGLRPSRVVEEVSKERSRLLGRSFSARYFLADLASAYDGLIELESAKNRVTMSGHEVGLRDAYQRLVPMRQWRTDYPETFFAFDLHRLFQSGEVHAPDRRRVHLAPARQARLNLTILDGSGRESQLGLIAFRGD